ncbi:MAG: hypothetical protein SWH54_07580 [Thermodesulfobacteriota bacterium]|nr:hypothetical protein [Thermodesulfobacteriota bacterium]
MNQRTDDDLPRGSFYGLVTDKISVDAFKPKFGDAKNFAVFSFLVKQKDTATKLKGYILQKNFDLFDVEVSPNPEPDPQKDGKYILFIEMLRNKDMFATMDKLLLHIDHLVSIKQWHFKTSAVKEYMDWNRDNFLKAVCQSPDEYSNQTPVSKDNDEIDPATQNSNDGNINHRLLEKIIQRQMAKLNQSYIESLKEHIKAINENKLQLSRHIEDLKIDRDRLYKQLELSHDREKIALLREQQDFKRIKSLKKQLALLTAPASREMEIVIPDETAYDTDTKPVEGLESAVEEIKDEEEIYTETRDEYQKAPLEEEPPDESPVSNKSSGPNVVSDLPDRITIEESSGFVRQMYCDDPNKDESKTKPLEHEDPVTSINNEPENPEKEKIDTTHNETENLAAEPSTPAKNDEILEFETPVELQDLKHVESDDSAAESRSDDIIVQSLIEKSTAKVEDESRLADDLVPKYMVLGRKALEKNDYDRAIEYFLKVVDILPTAGTVVLNLADLYFIKQEFVNARKYAIQAMELGEESATLLLEKIDAVLAEDAGPPSSIDNNIGKISENLIARQDGTNQEEEELEDTVFIEMSALNEAADSAEEKIPNAIKDIVSQDDEKIEPKDDARKYMTLGIKAAGMKDYHQAIEHFSKAVEILPDSASGFFNLAVLNYKLKEYETAYMHAEKAIELGSPSAVQILEKIKPLRVTEAKSPQVDSGKERETFFIESAAATLEEFIKTEKIEQTDTAVDSSHREKDAVVNDIFKLGLAALGKKEFSQAIRHFNKVVELLPNGIPSYIHLTKIHYKLGKYRQARKYAKKAFELGDYTLKPILAKIDAKLAKQPAQPPSTGPIKLKEQQTPAETAKDTKEKPEVQQSHHDAKPGINAGGNWPEPKLMGEKPDVDIMQPVALVADSRQSTTPADSEQTVSEASTDEKKNKPPLPEVPIETGEVKLDHITKAKPELHSESLTETITQGKTALKQSQNLAKPADTTQPEAKDEFTSETPSQDMSLQTENPKVPREYGSIDEYFEAGLAASERNDFNFALEYFNKVALALPKAPASFLNMADIHYRMKNFKTARKHAERALDLGAHSAHRILSKIEDSLKEKSSPAPLK